MAKKCFFVTDLHGDISRYQKLFKAIETQRPSAVFMGGDILPSHLQSMNQPHLDHQDFLNDFIKKELETLRKKMKPGYPDIFVILGNDDGRFPESSVLDIAAGGLWNYVHNRCVKWKDFLIFGYSYIPPTPFRLKDWERYDVSRYVDPGCIPPTEGALTIDVPKNRLEYATIAEDLDILTKGFQLEKSIFLFHSPPYKSKLDRAALDGKMIDYVPLDVHVGSIAIERFIKAQKPCITLHGHVHESARITGAWMEKINQTWAFSAAHDGPELALVMFNPEKPSSATRKLL